MVHGVTLDAPSREPGYGSVMSVEEWEQMDEDDPGELVDGLLEEEEVADSPHEVIVNALLRVLFSWESKGNRRVLSSETKYALSRRRGRKPDISVFLTRNQKLPRRGAMRRPPDIMIEVISPDPRDRRRDRIEKLNDYAAFGVRWYWLIDTEARSVEILKLGEDGRYVHALDAAGGTIDVPGCDELTLDLDALWRELDEEIETEAPPSGG